MEASRRHKPATGALAALRRLYEGDAPRAHAFRYGLVAFDVATILFLVASSFFPRTAATEVVDAVIGLVILADFAARLTASRRPVHDLLHPAGSPTSSPSSRSWRRWWARASPSCAWCAPCACSTPTRC